MARRVCLAKRTGNNACDCGQHGKKPIKFPYWFFQNPLSEWAEKQYRKIKNWRKKRDLNKMRDYKEEERWQG